MLGENCSKIFLRLILLKSFLKKPSFTYTPKQPKSCTEICNNHTVAKNFYFFFSLFFFYHSLPFVVIRGILKSEKYGLSFFLPKGGNFMLNARPVKMVLSLLLIFSLSLFSAGCASANREAVVRESVPQNTDKKTGEKSKISENNSTESKNFPQKPSAN